MTVDELLRTVQQLETDRLKRMIVAEVVQSYPNMLTDLRGTYTRAEVSYAAINQSNSAAVCKLERGKTNSVNASIMEALLQQYAKLERGEHLRAPTTAEVWQLHYNRVLAIAKSRLKKCKERDVHVSSAWTDRPGQLADYLTTLPLWNDRNAWLTTIDSTRGYEPGNLRFIRGKRRRGTNYTTASRKLQRLPLGELNPLEEYVRDNYRELKSVRKPHCTQQELATRASVPTMYVSRVENGKTYGVSYSALSRMLAVYAALARARSAHPEQEPNPWTSTSTPSSKPSSSTGPGSPAA